MNINIAVIITCFNRKAKTIECLKHLLKAYNSYNYTHIESPIKLTIYLTDDGCTDGTADAVRNISTQSVPASWSSLAISSARFFAFSLTSRARGAGAIVRCRILLMCSF